MMYNNCINFNSYVYNNFILFSKNNINNNTTTNNIEIINPHFIKNISYVEFDTISNPKEIATEIYTNLKFFDDYVNKKECTLDEKIKYKNN